MIFPSVLPEVCPCPTLGSARLQVQRRGVLARQDLALGRQLVVPLTLGAHNVLRAHTHTHTPSASQWNLPQAASSARRRDKHLY